MDFFFKILFCLSFFSTQIFSCEKDIINDLTFQKLNEISKKYNLELKKEDLNDFDPESFRIFIRSKLEDRYHDLIEGNHELLCSEVNEKLEILYHLLQIKSLNEDFFTLKLKILSEELNKNFRISNELAAEIIKNEYSNGLQFIMLCLFSLED